MPLPWIIERIRGIPVFSKRLNKGGLLAILCFLAGSLLAFALSRPSLAAPATAPTRTPIHIQAPAPTATATTVARTTITPLIPPPTLAPPFVPDNMYRWAKPATYIDDACQYLRQRWDPAGSPPGAIVVTVMYHRIRPRAGMDGIPEQQFRADLAAARRMGYETVTAPQVADFLEHNARIPYRSLLLIVDDRRAGIIERYFMPVLQQYDWTVTSAWIIANSDDIPNLWARMEALNASGRVDVQSHGLRHTYIVPSTPTQRIREELFGPIPIHEQHFGYRPVAFIWPGGNFTAKAVAIAREAGYHIGFTIYPNGPVMFNWVPLGKTERAVGDPLMLLPRYWGNVNLAGGLRDSAAMGDAAHQQALASFAEEATYYHAHCGGELATPAGGYP